jgi:hypothetical protein
LELVQSSGSVEVTDFAALFTPITNYSSISRKITTFRVQEFKRIFEDGTSKKFYALVTNDYSAATSRSGRRRVQLYSDFFSLQTRNTWLRAIMSGLHGVPPDMEGILSLFTPNYSVEELSSGNSDTDPKTWELVSNFSS